MINALYCFYLQIARSFFSTSEGRKEMSNENSTQTTKKRDLIVIRVFDAPVEQVWKAWSDPSYVMQWWGPEGFTSPLANSDLFRALIATKNS
jgi:hypothetical protein